MRYTAAAHVVNVLAIAAVFLGPIGYCLSDPSIPVETGRGVIMLSFLLGAIAIADWYGAGFTNSMAGILFVLAASVAIGIAAVGITAASTDAGFVEVATFSQDINWSGRRLWLKLYVAALGGFGLGVVAIPRLILLQLTWRPPRLPFD